MRRKHEIINGHPLSVWDNGGKTPDRYTVVYLDDIFKSCEGIPSVSYLGMSESPFSPQGFGQHGEMPLSNVAYRGRGGVFEKRISFNDLPDDCKKAVYADLSGEN